MHEHLEVDPLREPPEELPVGLVVLLDEVVRRPGAVDRPLVDAGAVCATLRAMSAAVMFW